ncbi:LOW QUALITY PROTEIN: hypothetical protein OSB04_019068 [Centaurea solstitialis]|uniref:Uncharacterized protein n=1 Tax=Centaurea solstitialis TaxID=347529 RepID=A0AA38SPK5_9ASTR|nr:LOW QUALITY PROTEIN: hypothetical protein OSB04_019068 [Centaurea solstitialis]
MCEMSSCMEYPEVFPVDLDSLPPDRETELQICLNGRSDAYRQSIVSAGTGGDEIDDDAAARTALALHLGSASSVREKESRHHVDVHRLTREFNRLTVRDECQMLLEDWYAIELRQLKIRGEDCVTLFLDELILVSIDDILNYSRTAEELSNAWHEVNGCGFRTKDLETLSLRDEVSVYTNHEEPSVPVQHERSWRDGGALGTLGASIKGAVLFWKAVMTSKACGYTSEDFEECARKPKYSVRPGANEIYRGLTYRRPGMKKDIAHFVERCVACFHVKIERQRPCGNCNSYQAPSIPRACVAEIVRRRDIPLSTVSDRDARLYLDAWRSFQLDLGTRVTITTVNGLHSDGQSERVRIRQSVAQLGQDQVASLELDALGKSLFVFMTYVMVSGKERLDVRDVELYGIPEVFPVDLDSLPPDRETELQICLNGRSDAYRQSIVSAGTGGDEIDDDAAARTGAKCFSKIGMRSSYRQLKIRGEDCVTLFLDELILVSIDDILNYSRTAEELSNAWHEVNGCGFRTKDLETLSLRDEVSVYTNHEEPSVPVQHERVILRIGRCCVMD